MEVEVKMKKKTGETEIVKYASQQKYDKANTTQIRMKLNLKTDADILAKLESVGNKQGYIKALIRADIEKEQRILNRGRSQSAPVLCSEKNYQMCAIMCRCDNCHTSPLKMPQNTAKKNTAKNGENLEATGIPNDFKGSLFVMRRKEGGEPTSM